MSVAMPLVRSQISGPGIGRSGGSMSGGPIHTWTPWIRPSDIWTTSVRITRSFFGVMLLRPLPGAHRLADGRLDRHQVGVPPQKRADWNQVLGLTTLCDHGGLAAQCLHEQPVVGHGGILPVGTQGADRPKSAYGIRRSVLLGGVRQRLR